MTGTDPLLGSILSDDFRMLKPLGFGGYARVYIAEQLSVGRRKVAIKVLHNVHVDQSGQAAVAALKREAAYLAMLRSPVFPRILRTGMTQAGLPFFAMEFIVGRSLEATIKEGGPLPVNRVSALLDEVCEGLAEMHGRDILHRDLKPGNIVIEKLISGSERARLIDLGSAKPTYEGESVSLRSGRILSGSPPYIAPETAELGRTSELTDEYGIGAVAYEMLCGVRAIHVKDTAPESYMAYLKSTEPIPTFRIAMVQPDVPEDVEAVILRALSRNPSDRFGSVSEFRAALLVAAGLAQRTPAGGSGPKPLPRNDPSPMRIAPSRSPPPGAFDRLKGLLRFRKP